MADRRGWQGDPGSPTLEDAFQVTRTYAIVCGGPLGLVAAGVLYGQGAATEPGDLIESIDVDLFKTGRVLG